MEVFEWQRENLAWSPLQFMTPSTYLWRGQFVVSRSSQDLEQFGLERSLSSEFDLWTSPELPLVRVGPVTVLGLAAVITGDSLEDHFATATSASTPREIADLALDLTGRFVLVADLASGLSLIPDALGSRRVFLSAGGTVASSSEILLRHVGAESLPLTPAARRLPDNPLWPKREFATFGLHSPISGYRRLLPNREVNLDTGLASICDPATEKTDTSVPDAARTIRRVAKAISGFGPVNIGLTAGFDSRLILAAFHAEGIEVFNYTFADSGSKKHLDAEVAKAISLPLGYRHETITEPEPDPEILDLLKATQTIVRPLPHVLSHLTWFSRQEDQMLTVSGNGGEVARSHFGLAPRHLGREISKRALLGHTASAYDVEAFDDWWDDRFPHGACNLPPTTLHYWEQRAAIWGAQFPSEKDLFTNEVSGFSSGRLQRELVSFPQIERSSLTSSLFNDLVEELSPELARLEPPTPTRWQFRVNHATPIPIALRTVRRGWGQDT